MRKVTLRMNEQIKFDTIKRVASNEISIKRATVLLKCSTRTIYNLIKKYKSSGKKSFIHGNRGRKPSTTLDNDLSMRIIALYKDTYIDANFKHFQDLLEEKENIKISYFKLYTLLSSVGFISPKCNRLTLRKMNTILKSKLENKVKLTPLEESYIASTNLQDPITSHPRTPRAKYQGELIQMDASQHLWFGKTKSFLHLAVDDASGQIIGAYFDLQETLNGYYNVLHQILTTRGIPACFLTDRRTVFEYNNLKSPSDEKDTFTQFGYACHCLGIELRTTSIPQAKGRIERMFGTLQSRLITELKLAGITDIQRANKFIISFTKNFNNKFSVPINYTKSVYEEQISLDKINYTLAVISKRKVDNGNSIKYNKKYYQFYDRGSLVLVKPKTICCVLKAFDGTLLASIGEELFELHELEINHKVSKTFDLQPASKPKYKGHKPKDCHPWTYYSFKKSKSRRLA